MVGAPEARQHLAETAGAVQLRLALGALDGALQAAAEETLLLRTGGGGGGRRAGLSGGPWVTTSTPSPGAVGSREGGQGGPRGAGTTSPPPPSEKALRKGRLAQPQQERPVSTERLGHVALGGLGRFSSRNTPGKDLGWIMPSTRRCPQTPWLGSGWKAQEAQLAPTAGAWSGEPTSHRGPSRKRPSHSVAVLHASHLGPEKLI